MLGCTFMTGQSLAALSCPRCGHRFDPCNDDLDLSLRHPWHLRGRESVRQYVASLGAEAREWLLALYVDESLNLLSVETVARGSVSGIQNISVAAIVCRCQSVNASGFILVHNHPSGDPRPSETDIRFTNVLRRLSQELNLPLLSHYVIAGDEMMAIGGM